MNYDSTLVGVPYPRMPSILITTPVPGSGIPSAQVTQVEAIKLADGSYRELRDLPTLNPVFDLAAHGNDLIQLVDSATGANLPANHPVLQAMSAVLLSGKCTLNMAMLMILSVLRAEQVKVNG